MTIRPCGDSMLLIELEAVIDPVINERAILLAARLRTRAGRGVLDIAPGYCTVVVHFDPLQTDLGALENAIQAEAASIERIDNVADRHPIEIPVRYGGDRQYPRNPQAVEPVCDSTDRRHGGRRSAPGESLFDD